MVTAHRFRSPRQTLGEPALAPPAEKVRIRKIYGTEPEEPMRAIAIAEPRHSATGCRGNYVASARCRGLWLPAGLLAAAHPPADAGLDEAVDIAVEHRLRVANLVVGAQILHHLVRMDHVGAHLIAPRVAAVALEPVHLGLLLAAALLEQARLEHPHGGSTVLDLRLLVLAGDHDAGREVSDPHRRVGRVDALPTRAGGAEHIDPDVVLGDLDVVVLLHHRQHLDASEAGLPATLVVERADPDQPVGALLDRERAVGVRGVNGER